MAGDQEFVDALASLGGGTRMLGAFAGLVEIAPFAVYVDHPVQGCIYANQALLDMWGMSWEDFRGFGWARCVHPDDVERFQELIRRYEHTLEPFNVSYRIEGPAIGRRWIRSQVTAVRGDDGSHQGTVAIAFDVTAEREHASRTAQAQRLEAVGQLAGRVAHDFNNLLSAIYASSSVLASEVTSVSGKECLDAIDSAVESAQQVTNHLLALSRHKVRGRPCCPDDELLQLEPLLRRTLGEGVALMVVPNCGASWVPLDAGHFSQIVINLALNARDAMPSGGTLAIVTRRDGEHLVLELQDSGAGVPEHVLPRAFEPFFTTKESDRGTGLGLSTVKDLVHLVGGTVSLQNSPQGGALARVSLPVLDVRPEDMAPVAERVRGSGASELVLLVDDHDALRQSLSYALALYGFGVTAARSLTEARERLAEERPAAIVLDVLLPDGRGVELLRELRGAGDRVPVILTSGYVGKASDGFDADLEDPRTAFLPKPVRPRDLADELLRLLRDDAAAQ
ncbi:MAG: ATP-binding protein [Planctomycetota bacterium]